MYLVYHNMYGRIAITVQSVSIKHNIVTDNNRKCGITAELLESGGLPYQMYTPYFHSLMEMLFHPLWWNLASLCGYGKENARYPTTANTALYHFCLSRTSFRQHLYCKNKNYHLCETATTTKRHHPWPLATLDRTIAPRLLADRRLEYHKPHNATRTQLPQEYSLKKQCTPKTCWHHQHPLLIHPQRSQRKRALS